MTARGNWRDFLSLRPVTSHVQQVYYSNGVCIGAIVQDVDGYWKYSFDDARQGAFWDGYIFQLIFEMLEDQNREWDAEIAAYFEGMEDD